MLAWSVEGGSVVSVTIMIAGVMSDIRVVAELQLMIPAHVWVEAMIMMMTTKKHSATSWI